MTLPAYIESTFIENWPAGLRALSMRTESVEIGPEDVIALGSYHPNFRERFVLDEVYDLSSEATETLSTAVAKFTNGLMPRLGYCSWKGSAIDNVPVRSIRDLMAVITRPDDRVERALTNAAAYGEGTVIHLREWIDMDPAGEFRIFLKRGQVSGVSQYFWKDSFPGLRLNIDRVRSGISSFLHEFVRESHIEDVIADVHVDGSRGDRALLIELNPLISSADHCLYQSRDFDRRLRFLDDGKVMAVGLS